MFSSRSLLLLCEISLFFSVLSAQNIPSRDQTHNNPDILTNSSTVSTKGPSDDLLEKWETIDRSLKGMVDQILKRLLPIVMERYEASNVSSTCTGNVLKFLAGLKNSKVWAFSILDASGKGLDGLLSGSLAAIGDYDQCLNTVAINERRGSNYGKVLFRGKYCAVDIRPPLPHKKSFYKIDEVLEELKNFSKRGTVIAEMAKSAHFFYMISVRIGLCVPSGCSKEDISNILQHITQQASFDIAVKRCEVKEEKKITPIMMFVWALYGFLGLLLIIGTTVDVIYYYQKRQIQGTGLKVLTSFSFVTNFQKLVNTSSSSGNLCCLSGIKALSMTWIILGHTYFNINYQIFQAFWYVM